MIYFDDWLLRKGEGPVIARQYDNLTGRLEILGQFPEGWDWTLLDQADKHLDIIALVPMEGGLGVDLTKEMLAIGGYHTLQLKGTKGELVRHTNQLHNVLIPDSLSGDANWPVVPSEFSQVEARIRELGEHPPIPGDEGFWLVWDLERDEYVTSDLPLPDVSVGPDGKAATIKVGETVTGDPGTQASVTNVGTENAAVFNFTIPAGAVGPTGATPDISVQVTGLPAGAEPTVAVSGTPERPVITLGIPAGQQGSPGQTPTITIGQVTTLPAGSPVTASITGQTPNLVLNLGIPQGAAGVGVPPATGIPDGYTLQTKDEQAVWGKGVSQAWMPRLISKGTVNDEVSVIGITEDQEGNPFLCKLLTISVKTASTSSNTQNLGANLYLNNTTVSRGLILLNIPAVFRPTLANGFDAMCIWGGVISSAFAESTQGSVTGNKISTDYANGISAVYVDGGIFGVGSTWEVWGIDL